MLYQVHCFERISFWWIPRDSARCGNTYNAFLAFRHRRSGWCILPTKRYRRTVFLSKGWYTRRNHSSKWDAASGVSFNWVRPDTFSRRICIYSLWHRRFIVDAIASGTDPLNLLNSSEIFLLSLASENSGSSTTTLWAHLTHICFTRWSLSQTLFILRITLR